MEKINIAELLKDCPKNMELDCTAFNNVKFQCADNDGIWIEYIDSDNNNRVIYLTCEGGIKIKNIETKCVIYPKGKTTWEGFHRPFKDGDVVCYSDCIAIFKEWCDETLFRTYVTAYLHGDSTIDIAIPLFGKSIRRETRLATEEEKQKLFDAIKENGYKWNSETKTLEKLIEPKFKVGDNWSAGYVVETCNLQPYKEETMEEQIATEDITLEKSVMCTFLEIVEGKQRLRIAMNEGFELKEENGNFFVYKKNGEYPKTYEECCKILKTPIDNFISKGAGYKAELLSTFQKLLIFRDAYWKIAGEQMCLGKPWKQDYNDRCFIIANNNGNIHTYEYHGSNNVILAFPTEEMRDAFYEKFKELIETVKELL